MGTVVEHLEGGSVLVEFSDEAGEAYAILPLRFEQVIVLHRKTNAA
jgi:hypothetical protein